MLKTILLLLFLGTGTVLQAQQTNPTDTLPRRDSIVEEVKESVLENIPTVSLDDNDLGDVSAQNVSSILTAGRDPFFYCCIF